MSRTEQGRLSHKHALRLVAAGLVGLAVGDGQMQPQAFILPSHQPTEQKAIHVYQNGETINNPFSPIVDGWNVDIKLAALSKYQAAHPNRTVSFTLRNTNDAVPNSELQLSPQSATPQSVNVESNNVVDAMIGGEEYIQMRTVAQDQTTEVALDFSVKNGNDLIADREYRLKLHNYVSNQSSSVSSEVPIPDASAEELDSVLLEFDAYHGDSRVFVIKSQKHAAYFDPREMPDTVSLDAEDVLHPQYDNQARDEVSHAEAESVLKHISLPAPFHFIYSADTLRAVADLEEVHDEALEIAAKEAKPSQITGQMPQEVMDVYTLSTFNETKYAGAIYKKNLSSYTFDDPSTFAASAITTWRYYAPEFVGRYKQLNTQQRKEVRKESAAVLHVVDTIDATLQKDLPLRPHNMIPQEATLKQALGLK